MSLVLRNSWNFKGSDWWEWEAFVDDLDTGELNAVEFVEYVLHPTFPNPIRRVYDRRSKFKLVTEGWGTFKLKAFAKLKDGKRIKLELDIQLKTNPRSGISK